MSKPIKNMLTDYMKTRYEGVESACVVDLTGLDVTATQHIRATLREKQARMEVLKNRLARHAFSDTPLAALGAVLQGPCALVVSEDSIIDVAKALVELTKEYKTLELKQAMLDGDPQLMSVADMSKLKSRMELMGDLAGCIGGPGRRLAGSISSPQGKIAGCLKAIAEKE